MNISVTCRHDYKTDEVKNYALEKVKKLGRFFNNITKIEIILDLGKDMHSADALISVSRGIRLVGHALHENDHGAIDLVIDKMERQLVRFKEKVKDRRGSRRGEESPRSAAGGEEDEGEDGGEFDDTSMED